MTRLSVFRKLNFHFFVLGILSIAAVLIILGSIKSSAESNKDPQNPNSKARWITVDESELSHIQNVSENTSSRVDLKIFEKRGGISIIEADEEQTLDLSRNMHTEFNKCAGFMAHETLEAARLSIENSSLADSTQQIVEYSINNQAAVNPMIAETREANIRETITRLSTDFPTRRYNQPSGVASANWIKNRWTALAAGRNDITVEFFNHTYSSLPAYSQPSVILTVRGTNFPDEVVVLGGHQDSINWVAGAGHTGSAPGADDDASGIASLTETIRVMVAKNFRPQRTVKFMAYAAEEIGLVGSQAIAADFRSRGVNVIGVLQLDMTNYQSPGAVADIAITTDSTNASQNNFLRNLIAFYQPTLVVADDTCGYSCSDHAAWYNQGFVVSFPFEGINSNPTIHTPSDTLAQSNGNASHALKFTNIAVAYLGELAKGTSNITTAASVKLSGRVLEGRRGISRARVSLSDANGAIRTTLTNSSGYYQFTDVAVGEIYTLDAQSKRYKFTPQLVNVTEELIDLNFYLH
jgi:leucyl aminopeptidase